MEYLCWLAVISLASVVRLARLADIPPALFRDEAEKLYNAYCLFTSGRDCQGNPFPLFVEVFGVTTSAIYQYSAIPFVWLFGLSEWTARLPAALVGILTVIVTFAWVKHQRGLGTAVWAALFLALSPWHITFSRWAQQGIFLPLLLACSMLSWQYYLRGKRWGIVGTAMSLALAMYTYDVARAFVPLILAGLVVAYWRVLRNRWRETLLGLLVFAVFSSPTFLLLSTNTEAAQARFNRISIFQPGMAIPNILGTFVKNYFMHLSPNFLLFHGDAELRHGVGVGVLTLTEFVGLVVGVISLIRSRKPENIVLLFWLAAFPVAASLTREGIPHALRTIVALPGLQVIAACGIKKLERACSVSWRKYFREMVVALALLGALPFIYKYFTSYKSQSAFNWQYGVKQALELLRPYEDTLDWICFNGIAGAEYLVAVYAKIPPSEFHPHRPSAQKYVWDPHLLSSLFNKTAVAVVSVPYAPSPPKAAVIPILAPNSEDVVAVIYINERAQEKMRQAETHVAR